MDVFASLNSVPRGFYEDASCDPASPGFVRGYLVNKAAYDAMSSDERFRLLSGEFPRWALYGVPLQTRQDADEWDTYLTFWADSQGMVWLSYGTGCVAPNWGIKWPPDSSFQWTWVYENEARRVTRVYDANTGKNEYKWV